MCHPTDARPPLPPIRGGAVDARDLTLTSADGTAFAAHLAVAETPGGAGMVVVPDIRGLHPFYEDLANRLAEAGVHAIAIDLYARTAGSGRRGADFDPRPHVVALQPEQIAADVAVAIDTLEAADGGGAERFYVMGFCVGGRIAFLQAGAGHGLAGVIGFYGPPAGPHRSGLPAPIEEVRSFTSPVLGLFGGADPGIPAESIDAFDVALGAAGIEHRLVTYPDAPHSFFDRSAAEHAEAANGAWSELLDFVGVLAH
ncbi:MAG TPA: dienelactone hydrolase family protein [Candidatus Limnocylindria bacterium]|jgi:carboxymethylenebutenolidase